MPWWIRDLIFLLLIWYFFGSMIISSIKSLAGESFNPKPCVSNKLCSQQMNPEGANDPAWRAYYPSGYSGEGVNLYLDSVAGTPASPGITAVDMRDVDKNTRDQNYADWMRYLEFEAQKKIAGCNSPPDVTSMLWGGSDSVYEHY